MANIDDDLNAAAAAIADVQAAAAKAEAAIKAAQSDIAVSPPPPPLPPSPPPPPPPVSPPPPAGPIVLTTTSGGSFTDSKGAIWTLSASGNAMMNNAPVAGGSGTGELAYAAPQVYGQDAKDQHWYSWTGSTWAPSGPPGGLPVSPPPPPVSPPTTTGWTAGDISVPGVQLPSGKKFHYNLLLPLNFDPTKPYPVLVHEHEDGEGYAWYIGQNKDPLYAAMNQVDYYANTAAFRAAYPCIVIVPYADQTTGESAIQNFGGWFNNGQTGDATHFNGETGPNVFAVAGLVKALISGQLPGIPSSAVDASRLYITGDSLGGIGTLYMMSKYSALNGTSDKLFAAGLSMAGVLECYGKPTSAIAAQFKDLPIFAVSGANDTTSKPGDWNQPLWQQLAGNSNYPAYPGARAGTSQFWYLQDPSLGHGVWPTYRALPKAKPIFDWLFAQKSGVVVSPPISPPPPPVSPPPPPAGTPKMLPAGYLSVKGNQFVDASGTPVLLSGAGWWGAEEGNCVPYGMWQVNYKDIMDGAKAMGLNIIRWTYADQAFDQLPPFGGTYGINQAKNPDLTPGMTTFQVMDKAIAYGGSIGLKFYIAHMWQSGRQSSLWYDSSHDANKVLSNLVAIARHYAGNPAVFGIEIHNEINDNTDPRLTWEAGVGNAATNVRNWGDTAQAAIYAVNPDIIVFFQAPQTHGNGTGLGHYSSGDLSPLANSSLRFKPINPTKWAYTIHTYPHSVIGSTSQQPSYWDPAWGFVFSQGLGAILISEFGFDNTIQGQATQAQAGGDNTKAAAIHADDLKWRDDSTIGILAYIKKNIAGIPAGGYGPSWSWWSLNASGPSTGSGDAVNDSGFSLAKQADWKTPIPEPNAALRGNMYGVLAPA